jgi:hypothetical protein
MRIARTEVLSVEATGERCDSERITHRSVEGRWKRIGEDTSLAAYPTPKVFTSFPGDGWWRSPNHKTPETLRLTEPTPRPMLGRGGLLNLLNWVEHRQQTQNAAHEEGGALCLVSHVTASPPAQYQAGHRPVDEFAPGQSSAAPQASESPPRTTVGATPGPKQGGQR